MKRVLLGLLLVILLAVGGGIIYLTSGLARTAALTIGNVDFRAAANGTYQGEYLDGRWTNRVQVTIADGRVVAIELQQAPVFSQADVNQQLFARVIEQQSLQVDAISGATVTCKALLKAIEHAIVPAE